MLLLPLVAPVRVVLANILSSVITTMLPTISAAVRPGGVAVFCGILLSEREAMLATLRADGQWRVARETSEGEWWAVVVERAGE